MSPTPPPSRRTTIAETHFGTADDYDIEEKNSFHGKEDTLISTQYEIITPAIAEAWLSLNRRNRSLSMTTVAAYARDMSRGAWIDTHQSIGFDTNGNLVDGQHRLAAIVRSGTTQTILVSRGLPIDAQKQIDSQRRRTFADQLRIDGTAQAAATAALARSLLSLEQDREVQRATNSELADALMRHAEGVDWWQNASREKLVSRAAYSAVLVALYPRFSEKVRAFHEQVQIGAELSRTSPAFQLRRWLLNKTTNRGGTLGGSRFDNQVRFRTASAFHAFVNDRPLFSAPVPNRAKFAELFGFDRPDIDQASCALEDYTETDSEKS